MSSTLKRNVVLVNSNCMSAGDGMAKFLGDCPNVTLMGITASSGVNQNNGGYIYLGAVQKEMGSPNYFKFTREFKSAKI